MSEEKTITNKKKKAKRKLIFPAENKTILRELTEIVLLTLILIIGIKNLIGEPRWIPSGSMIPTLIEGDRVFLEKFFSYPKEAKRGDIMVFYPPSTILKHDPWNEFTRALGFLNNDVAYIKRLIGLPGDTVFVKENVGVFINGKLLDEPYVKEVASRGCGTTLTYCGPLKLKENQYFMMGDNRNDSKDSRDWGPLNGDRFLGRSIAIWWPIDRLKITTTPKYPNMTEN